MGRRGRKRHLSVECEYRGLILAGVGPVEVPRLQGELEGPHGGRLMVDDALDSNRSIHSVGHYYDNLQALLR